MTRLAILAAVAAAACTVRGEDDDCVALCTNLFDDCTGSCEEDTGAGEGDDCTLTCENDRDVCVASCDED
jgi:hypothetical protein